MQASYFRHMNKQTFLFTALLLLAIAGCEPEEVAPDLCAATAPVTAKFKMYERVSGIDTTVYIETPGLTLSNSVRFVADEADAEYEWRVGTDDRVWRTRSFELAFFTAPGETLDIKLKVRKDPNRTCHPQDDGLDSTVAPLRVLPYGESPMKGYYQGYVEGSPSDTFTIRIAREPLPGRDPSIGPVYRLMNLNRGCKMIMCGDSPLSGCDNMNEYAGTTVLLFNGKFTSALDQGCLSPWGIAYLSPDGGSIRVEYQQLDLRLPLNPNLPLGWPLSRHRFVGRRIGG